MLTKEQIDAERDAFEAWAKDHHWRITRSLYNAASYASADTQSGWQAWQAAIERAVLDRAAEPVAIDLNDVIHNPRKYTVDGKPVSRARLAVQADNGYGVYIHQHDYDLQIKRLARVAAIEGVKS